MVGAFLSYLQKRVDLLNPNENSYFKKHPDQLQSFTIAKNKVEESLNQQIENNKYSSIFWWPFEFIRSILLYWSICDLESYADKSWKREICELFLQVVIVVFIMKYVFTIHVTPTGSAEPNILIGDRVFSWRCNYYFSPIKHGDLIIFIDPTFKYDEKNPINNFWQKHIGLFSVPTLGLTEGPSFWVKRVVGLPGDIIEGKVIDGKTYVYRNGKELYENYVNPYPLIFVEYELGLFDKSLGLPEILTKRKQNKQITYDPSIPFEDQNFYKVPTQSVLKDFSGKPVMLAARTPTRYGQFSRVVDNFGPFVVPENQFWGMGDNRRGSYDARGFGLVDFKHVVGRASRILWSLDSHEPWWFIEFLKNPITFFTKKLRYSRFFRSLHPFQRVYET